ncbi:unannotated protein [freshwater metagenome]|uniref:Unannotated protein n=1 Tax=freshwater metagenome TaxID=449393 RepID=A0A6J7G482_9ZZZZ|nr:hypothetical protein [Actinomycetota bacterium]
MARRSPLSPSAYIRAQGLHRGLLGGSRGWLIAGGTFWTVRLLRRALGRREEVVALEVLRPGQVLRLEAIPQLTRSERRTLKSVGKAP